MFCETSGSSAQLPTVCRPEGIPNSKYAAKSGTFLHSIRICPAGYTSFTARLTQKRSAASAAVELTVPSARSFWLNVLKHFYSKCRIQEPGRINFSTEAPRGTTQGCFMIQKRPRAVSGAPFVVCGSYPIVQYMKYLYPSGLEKKPFTSLLIMNRSV